jgi:Holliday junction DNA helicase RuvA
MLDTYPVILYAITQFTDRWFGEERAVIGRLRGVVIEKQPPEVLLEVGGVGYEVQMPMSCFYDLPEIGKEATIHIHFVVREDAQLLYGFNHKQERALFRELIKTNGVGPKLALAILSGMTATQFVLSVEREEISSLVKLPGVGKKTAERLVVEMKDRLKGWVSHDLFSPAEISLPPKESRLRAPDASEEAASALVALGYKPQQASQIVSKIAIDGMSVEDIIRESLRSLV